MTGTIESAEDLAKVKQLMDLKITISFLFIVIISKLTSNTEQ